MTFREQDESPTWVMEERGRLKELLLERDAEIDELQADLKSMQAAARELKFTLRSYIDKYGSLG